MKIYNPEVKTISIGNITTGGVGKTPFTAELAKFYTSRMKKVAIISRGYGGSLSNKNVNVISDGTKIYFNAQEAGDEPYWLAENCPSTIILTCASRAKAAQTAVKDFGCNIIIADDAFQHRNLGRNIDLVLIDQKNKFGNNRLLPAGPLRESLLGIKRATALVVTNKSLQDTEALKYCDEIKKQFDKPVYLCKIQPSSAYNIKNNEPLYTGTSVLAFCAIGQPNEFFEFVKKDYFMQVALPFPDHHPYDEEDIKMLLEIADKNGINTMVTTEKDAVKIKDIFSKFKTSVKVYAMKLQAIADIEDIINEKN